MTTQSLQLQKLIQDGWSLGDAAEALNMDVGSAQMVLASSAKKTLTLSEMINEWKPRGIQILMHIAEDLSAENKDRIAAIKILVTGEGVAPDLKAGGLDERILLMKRAMGVVDNQQPKKPVIDIEEMKDKCYEVATHEVNRELVAA